VNIWLKASQCLTYRRVIFLSVTEITVFWGPHVARYLIVCVSDYSSSTRRDLTFFSPVFCFGVVGVSDEYSLSNGLGW
jgi:hypothetical protein